MLAQILDLLSHLVKFGYYDDKKDIEEIIMALIELLDSPQEKKKGKNIVLSSFFALVKCYFNY